MKKRTPAKPKRTAVARAVPSPDTQPAPPLVGPLQFTVQHDPTKWEAPTVFVVMGHRNGSHGVVGLYLSRDRAQQEVDALIAKGNKHSRSYTFTIDERRMYI